MTRFFKCCFLILWQKIEVNFGVLPPISPSPNSCDNFCVQFEVVSPVSSRPEQQELVSDWEGSQQVVLKLYT